MTERIRNSVTGAPVWIPRASRSISAPTTFDRENPITVLKRYELKYILTREQTGFLREKLMGRVLVDQFGKTTIASLYYDTPDARLIRASLEKPAFKEKIRLRSYGPADERSPVYLELKRKAHKIVYKRRIRTTLPQAGRFFDRTDDLESEGQIGRELAAFRDYYGTLRPSCLIASDRTAFFEPGGDLRLTVDENPRWRDEELRLDRGTEGTPLLPEGGTILEIKVQEALPLWLSSALCEGKIYQGSFSKYGEAYRQRLLNVNPKER